MQPTTVFDENKESFYDIYIDETHLTETEAREWLANHNDKKKQSRLFVVRYAIIDHEIFFEKHIDNFRFIVYLYIERCECEVVA